MVEQPPRISWWSRNWKWAVPVICVVGALVVVLPFLVRGAYFVVPLVENTFKSSGGYQEALALTRRTLQRPPPSARRSGTAGSPPATWRAAVQAAPQTSPSPSPALAAKVPSTCRR